MKALKIIGIILGIIILAVVVLMLTLPGKVHMERSIVINAGPNEVYNELITFEEYNAWSPWYERDTAAQYAYEGPHHGVGTKMMWTSNNPQVGNGSMWIVDAQENKMVDYRMEFDGYPGEPHAVFYLEPEASGTKVTWTYDEETSGIWKVMGLFVDMDDMLGPDYENGLENLKIHVESGKAEGQEENEEEVVEEESQEVAL